MIRIILILSFVLFSVDSFGVTIHQLFESLKNQPVTKIDIMLKKEAEAEHSKAIGQFFPEVDSIASYTHYNSPTNLRPTLPEETSRIQKEGGGMPFSKDIKQIGLEFKMPVFVYPLFSLASMTEKLVESASVKKQLNFIRNEAAIVSLNAKLQYLEKLMKSVQKTRDSLEEELKIVNVAVENGRLPGIASIKIMNKLNQLDINLNSLKTQRDDVTSQLETLTGITLDAPVDMYLKRYVTERVMFATKPLEYTLQAKHYAVKAKEGELYPSVSLSGLVSRRFGDAYNNGESVIRNYGYIGVNLKIPIFNKPIYADIEKAKSDYLKTEFELENLRQQLNSEVKSLNDSLRVVEHSIFLAKKNVEYQKKLLIYAKKAFELRRMTEEEFLRYEDALLDAEANLYGLKAKRWAIISRLAVIYGNDLEEIVQ